MHCSTENEAFNTFEDAREAGANVVSAAAFLASDLLKLTDD